MEEKGCMYDFENQDFFEIRNNYEGNKDIRSKLVYGNRVKKCDISIMIPTFLRNSYLQEALNSAVSQVTEVDYEIVVVDNNDKFDDNETLSVIEGYDKEKVSYYKNEKNLGMFGNWNRCIELASGDWILILHDDDIIENNYIDTMVKVVKNYPDAAAIGCDYNEINSAGEKLSSVSSLLHRVYDRFSRDKVCKIEIKDMYYVHPINIMGCLLNRKKAIEAGGFDGKWYPTSDYVFLLNLVNRWNVYHVSRHLFRYRVAVNISYRIDHVIGCLEADVSMRKSINRKHHITGEKKDIQFRSILESKREKQSFVKFGAKLTGNEKGQVQEEFGRYRKYCGLKCISDRKHNRFCWAERWYLFKMKCLRAKRVEL